MKKIICVLSLAFVFAGLPSFAAPGAVHHGGGHGGMMHAGISAGHRPMGGMHRPPMGGVHRPPVHHHVGIRPLPPPPPLYRPYRPIYRPYYSYYPSSYYTTYTYYPSASSYEVVQTLPVANTVVVGDNYAGINTAANVINTAANVAATIRYLSW